MIADVIVRPLAETDVREAAFWYESKREGLGAEFTLELDGRCRSAPPGVS